MPNYQNGKIYKIVSPSNPDMPPYFGSTTMLLCNRMKSHRNPKSLCKSKSLIGCGDAIIVLIENYPSSSREELSKKEAEYILNNDCCNKYIPARTHKERYDVNKELIKEKQKIYKEKYPERRQEINLKYREKNKEEIREKSRIFHENHKENFTCECGGKYTNKHKATHFKTNKHISYIGNQKTEV